LSHGGIPGRSGLPLLTSRVSVEMVHKAAAIDAPVMVAVSAPTALAVRTAEAAGITLVAIARSDSFEVFTHPYRVTAETAAQLPTQVAAYVALQAGLHGRSNCKFFRSQGNDQAVAGIADHLQKYWVPRMRSAIVDRAELNENYTSPGETKRAKETKLKKNRKKR
jgi:hypothetical protein